MQHRYNVIRILQDAGFTPCLWSEDALSYYNVPTVGFELYLLLPDSDIERASSLLATLPDYHQPPPRDNEMGKYSPRRYFLQYWTHRYMGPDSKTTGVQLLPAEEFAHFHISPETTVKRGNLLFPQARAYIESLVYQYLRPTQTKADLTYRFNVKIHLHHLSDYIPEPRSILPQLSPRAHEVWGNILSNGIVHGEDGIRYYRSFDEEGRSKS
jgi:hypothetical protein